jgi:hypothetical protein
MVCVVGPRDRDQGNREEAPKSEAIPVDAQPASLHVNEPKYRLAILLKALNGEQLPTIRLKL